MIVYFDTNAFRDLVEPGRADPDLTRGIIAKVRGGALQIAPSFEIVSELLLLWQHEIDNHRDPIKYQEAWTIFRDICDWNNHVLKDSGEIFQDDIKSFAKTGERANSYLPPMDTSCPLMRIILNRKDIRELFDSSDLKDVIIQTKTMQDKFLNGVLRPIQPRRLKHQPNDFADLFKNGRICKEMIVSYTKRFGVLLQCKRRGILRVLDIPTIRLGIGYLLYQWYKQITDNSQPEDNDAFDYRHAILAGAVGQIVTMDRKLTNTIKAIPGHNVKVSTLKALREELFTQP